jgi:ornithine cyclodeaminase/alanine dehydrogenase-like protein (mu-crystallin family)
MGMKPLRLLSEADVRSTGISLTEVLSLTEYAYLLDAEGDAEIPTKIGVHPTHRGSFLHAIPAWVGEARALGMKWISYFPGNLGSGIPDSTGIIILNDPDTGHPVCIMEGMYVTFLRTAACATVAVRNLMAKPPQSLTLVGCGGLGKWSLHMMTAAFPSLSEIFVASRTPRSRALFCEAMRGEGTWTITPVDEVAPAARQSDIVVSSIPPSAEKPLTADCLKPGSFFIPLDLTNSWQDDLLDAIDRVVADNPQSMASMLQGRRTSVPDVVSLQQVVAGREERPGPHERTFVGVCGIASTDMVVGWEIYRRAVARNIGTSFAMT